MKYEMIFGGENLFDGAPHDAVLVSVQLGDFRYFIEENLHVCKKFNIRKLQTCDTQLAMRRIIQEPKRWTVEDQKAGRLPWVGAKYDASGCIVEHLGVGVLSNSKTFYFRFPSGDCGLCDAILIKPLETPEEKALRLEHEFVQSFCSNDGIYERGLRDAYRKLSSEMPAKDGA